MLKIIKISLIHLKIKSNQRTNLKIIINKTIPTKTYLNTLLIPQKLIKNQLNKDLNLKN